MVKKDERAGAGRVGAARQAVRELYEGGGRRAQAFRYGVLALDLATLLYIVGTSFLEADGLTRVVDPVLGVVFLADLLARLWIVRRPFAMLASPIALAELAAIVSFLAPVLGGAAGFLRVLRTVRLLHAYQMLRRLRADLPVFRRHEDLLMAIMHLGVFMFVTTALVYESQVSHNDEINNYVDALYFTVAALTTTGFGDITLEGTGGHLLAVVIMIFGVTLFLRLAQVLFRPAKVRHECEHCGLNRHEADAVHCKHCGNIVHLDTEGAD
ncbi:MAG: ion channel [Thalassobaculum sp.]|uniref:potassium channel family protein n=1 Tax=Thalassobaculum sp. TaxID=2022740 RepID=UPI0032EDCA63